MISLKYLHKKISCLVCIIEVQGTVCVCVCVCLRLRVHVRVHVCVCLPSVLLLFYLSGLGAR